MLALLLLAQVVALGVLIGRLAPGRTRRPPVEPVTDNGPPRVTVLVPTLNEVARLQPCLEGLMAQGPTVTEILVIDSGSDDGTEKLVWSVGATDRRVRLIWDPLLPNGWIGKVWALQHGLERSSGEWVLNVDADIEPKPGMVAAAVHAAIELDLPVVSFSPRFAGQSAAEQWMQAALLVTLVYRGGALPASRLAPAHRVMANGQCFLARRDVLLAHGGYASARASFSDDVTLARHLASRGVRVGFLDGSRLFVVRSYGSLGHMWREWGRSLDLKDATTPWRLAGDVLFLALAQGVPLVLLALWAFGLLQGLGPWGWGLVGVNALLLLIRLSMLGALAGSYEKRQWTYWLSPLADLLAVLRILLSSLSRPRRWRGRVYA
jgi:dolichol-phosphate mannosyltransferase